MNLWVVNIYTFTGLAVVAVAAALLEEPSRTLLPYLPAHTAAHTLEDNIGVYTPAKKYFSHNY